MRRERASASVFPCPPLNMEDMGTTQRGRTLRRAAGCAALALLSACSAPEPLKIVKVSDVETHWALDNSDVGTQHIAPVVRFPLTNNSAEPQGSIDLTPTFRRKGQQAPWGG